MARGISKLSCSTDGWREPVCGAVQLVHAARDESKNRTKKRNLESSLNRARFWLHAERLSYTEPGEERRNRAYFHAHDSRFYRLLGYSSDWYSRVPERTKKEFHRTLTRACGPLESRSKGRSVAASSGGGVTRARPRGGAAPSPGLWPAAHSPTARVENQLPLSVEHISLICSRTTSSLLRIPVIGSIARSALKG